MRIRKSPTAFTRVRILAALLLASVAWGSTVEFTHHHGLRTAGATSASEVADTGIQAGEARLQDTDSRRSSSRSNSGSECSICQLQHNLATTLLSEHATAATDETCAAQSQLAAHVQFLQFTATLHGRAPPVSFLS